MEVIVVLQDEVASALQTQGGSPQALPEPLRRLLSVRALELSPVHRAPATPELRAYYRVDVATAPDAEEVIGELLECEGVDGAYLKPGAEPA